MIRRLISCGEKEFISLVILPDEKVTSYYLTSHIGMKQIKLNMHILSHSLYGNPSLSFKEVEYSHFIR